MPLILGLDPSLDKAGYAVLDTEQPYDRFVLRGRLKTSVRDGILVERLILQQSQIRSVLLDHDIKFVSMEAPYFGGNESEHLFALNQYIHRVFLELGTFVICFPPQQLKKLAVPAKKVTEIHKPQMVSAAKDHFNLHGQNLPDDEADALHAGLIGKWFYNWYFEKRVRDDELPEGFLKAFAGSKTYSTGIRKGVSSREGLIYRENELFFDFKQVSERSKRYHGSEERITQGRDQAGTLKKSKVRDL